MRDMRNTRKQIAARLGMAAHPGAKAKMASDAVLDRMFSQAFTATDNLRNQIMTWGKWSDILWANRATDAEKSQLDQMERPVLKGRDALDTMMLKLLKYRKSGSMSNADLKTALTEVLAEARKVQGMANRVEQQARILAAGVKKRNESQPKNRAARHGKKVRAGIMDRIGAAASALTASPADPTSPQYRQQLAAAKKTAQDAVGNYKFMRDKVKGRQDAMDKYVGAAIKTINASTNVQDVEHFAEQIQIAVRALSTMLSSVKTPFSRMEAGAKAASARKESQQSVLYGQFAEYRDSISHARSLADSYVGEMESFLSVDRKNARAKTIYAEAKKLRDQLNVLDRQTDQFDPYSIAGLRKGIDASKKWAEQAKAAVQKVATLRQQFRAVIKNFSRPGAKAKFASKRTTAGALRKQLRAQGITSPADLEWHGISANDPDNAPYWLHEDGSIEKIRASRPGAKAKMALPAKWLSEDRYIDERAKRQDEPDAPRFKQGKYIAFIHYRDRALQVDNKLRQTPPGAMRDELEAYLREIEQKKKSLASRPGAKATAAKPSDLEREDVKAGLKLMAASDEAVSDKIRTLIAEGKPQDQAVAIALDMKRRGEL